MRFELNMEKDGDMWLVTSPDFPELTTFGETKKQALEHGLDAIEEAIAARMSDNTDVPLPSPEDINPSTAVDIPSMTALKLGLYISLRNLGISKAELQRRMGVKNRETVDRLFRLDHNSRLDSIEQAYKAIDVPLRIEIPIPEAA